MLLNAIMLVCPSCSHHDACRRLAYIDVQDFRKWCILAYECGYREDDVVLKLTEACDTSTSMLPATHVVACTEGVCIVWLAIEQTAKTITRWSSRALRLSGFVCKQTTCTQTMY